MECTNVQTFFFVARFWKNIYECTNLFFSVAKVMLGSGVGPRVRSAASDGASGRMNNVRSSNPSLFCFFFFFFFLFFTEARTGSLRPRAGVVAKPSPLGDERGSVREIGLWL